MQRPDMGTTDVLRLARPVLIIAALFGAVAVLELVRGSTTAAVLVALDGALITAYAIGRLRAKARASVRDQPARA